jgi:hypothetical protein
MSYRLTKIRIKPITFNVNGDVESTYTGAYFKIKNPFIPIGVIISNSDGLTAAPFYLEQPLIASVVSGNLNVENPMLYVQPYFMPGYRVIPFQQIRGMVLRDDERGFEVPSQRIIEMESQPATLLIIGDYADQTNRPAYFLVYEFI